MAYSTYTTNALVCGTYDRNTADRSYRLFTRELGMLFADARSVRLEKSRQRQALTDFSLVRVSLVRGKAGWKIGSIVPLQNFYHEAESQAARMYVRDLVRVLRRFVTGEEPASELFDFSVEALGTLTSVGEPAEHLYDVLLVRVLMELGYVARGKVSEEVAHGRPAQLAARVQQANSTPHQTLKQLIAHAENVSQL